MLRPYKISDRETLIEIFKLNTPKFFAAKGIKDFEEYLDKYSATYFTIEYDEKIAGGIGYYIDPQDHTGHITWIFIAPTFKGHGLGKQAVEYCHDIFKAKPQIKKSVIKTSQFAFKFFSRFGYKLVKTEKNYWAEGLDLYMMEMEL